MTRTNAHAVLARLRAEIASWPNVVEEPHRFGGTEFRVGGETFGHVHHDGVIAAPLPDPASARRMLLGERVPAGWVARVIESDADLAEATRMLRAAYDACVAGRCFIQTPPQDALDEAVEESFPASDPPAVGHVDE